MRAPIDDDRVRRWIVELRALAFALVAALWGAIVVQALFAIFHTRWGDPDNEPVSPLDPSGGWVTMGPTLVLAWWALRAQSIEGCFLRAMGAGALNGPVTSVVLVLVAAGARADLGFLSFLLAVALCGSLATAPVGGILGVCFGGAVLPLLAVLDRIAARPTSMTAPNAVAAIGVWTLGTSGAALLAGSILEWGRETAGLLVFVASGATVLAGVVAIGRRAFLHDVERGALPGWRIEEDEEGARWLVREERGGEGAYREGVVSRRWARVSG